MYHPTKIAEAIGLILARLAAEEDLRDPGGEILAPEIKTEEGMIRVIQNEKGEMVADVYGMTDEEAEMRSALYRAAPEMFDLLKLSLEALDPSRETTRDRIRALLAKITKESTTK